VLIRKTSGPIFPRIRGTHLWYSTSPILFKAPKTGDERRVGDFTIRVDWPHLRVTCGHDWSREALEAAGGTFDVKVKGGDAPAPVGQMSGSSFSGGGRFQGGRRKYWCDCSEGPRPIAARPQKEAIRELQVVGERYALDPVEEIRYTFRKPLVEPFDFMPSEAIK